MVLEYPGISVDAKREGRIGYCPVEITTRRSRRANHTASESVTIDRKSLCLNTSVLEVQLVFYWSIPLLPRKKIAFWHVYR